MKEIHFHLITGKMFCTEKLHFRKSHSPSNVDFCVKLIKGIVHPILKFHLFAIHPYVDAASDGIFQTM